MSPGTIIRVRLPGLRRKRFRIKAQEGEFIHAWELEHGIAGKLRTFPTESCEVLDWVSKGRGAD